MAKKSRYSDADLERAIETASIMVERLGPSVLPLLHRLQEERAERGIVSATAEYSTDDIRAGLLTAAKLVERYGDRFLEYFVYLENELAKREAAGGSKSRALAMAKSSEYSPSGN